MKSAIIYYSYSGNTKQTAQDLEEYLKQNGQVDMMEIKDLDESESFFGQAARALWKKRARLSFIETDLSRYDLICLGTPVWAFGPAPAVNTFLDRCSGLDGKAVILFTTYGSGAGKNRCLNYMQKILAQKGARSFKSFSIQQFKVKDKDFVLSKIKEILPL